MDYAFALFGNWKKREVDIRWTSMIIVLALLILPVEGVDHIIFEKDGARREVTGIALIEAQDGGMLFQGTDGQIWTVLPDALKKREADDSKFTPLNADQVEQQLAERFGGFRIHQTLHYTIVSNADQEFVEYCGTLFERLYKGFYAFWKNNKLDLPEPKFPLVALVFKDKSSFLRYARTEAGPSADSIIGYYNLQSNRMTTYDVAEGRGTRAGVFVVDRNISTIIHEATHQLAYNCGLQKRYVDNPYWLSEGMAVFFESPDLNSRRGDGWRRIGRINEVNRMRFAQYFSSRPTDSLLSLIRDDDRFKNSATATTAYSEAWALTYFLIKTKPKEYVAYLKRISEGDYLTTLTPRDRVDMFREFFGDDLVRLDRQFIEYTRRFVFKR